MTTTERLRRALRESEARERRRAATREEFDADLSAEDLARGAVRWEGGAWESFTCLWPRKIEGRWHWLKRAERRILYVGGAMGLCCDMWRVEYRCAR